MTTNRKLNLAAFLFLALMIFCVVRVHATTAESSHANMTVQGTVRMVADDHLILEAGDEQHRFLVPEGTMIIVNSAEADLGEVMPGYFATVTGSFAGDNLVANFIDATRQYEEVVTAPTNRPQSCKGFGHVSDGIAGNDTR